MEPPQKIKSYKMESSPPRLKKKFGLETKNQFYMALVEKYIKIDE